MIGRIVTLAVLTASAVIVLSFGMFAVDEMSKASRQQQELARNNAKRLTTPSGEQADPQGPIRYDERGRQITQSKFRNRIDSINDTLVGPANQLVKNADSHWVLRGVPFLLGLAFWGFGGLFFARYVKTFV